MLILICIFILEVTGSSLPLDRFRQKMDLDKTEVMWVGKLRERDELNIRLEGKYIKQVKRFVYLGGNISENGRVDVEVRRRIQAGANLWRKCRQYTYGLETLALSELQQHKLQACGNNWIVYKDRG